MRTKQNVRLVSTIGPRELGSRRVTPDDIKQLLSELSKSHVDKFSHFSIWRFGEHEILQYPADQVHEALGQYDVKRIWGKGYSAAADENEPFIEIDLWHGGNIAEWGWLFRVAGPRDGAERALSTISRNIGRWQRTWHWLFHSKLYWLLMIILVFCLGAVTMEVLFSGVTVGLLTAVFLLVYMAAFAAVVIVGAGAMAPYIWFYRPGGPIESRRPWLPRLSVLAALAIAIGVLANLVTSVLIR